MDIEIAVIGESSKWVLNQSRIRIGQDSKCEVNLPAGRYPAASGEYVALDVVDGAISLVKGMRSSGETFLNGRPAGDGAAVRSGDVLRLGAGGPELRIRLLEPDADARPAEYEPTRVLYQPAPAMHEPTRMMHEPTRVISGPAATTYSPAPLPAAGTAGRYGYSGEAAPGVSASPYTSSASSAAPRRPDAGANAGGAQAGYGQLRGPEATAAQSSAARPADSGSLHILEDKLKTIRLILVGNLAILVLLFVWIFLQGRELSDNRKEVRDLRVQAQTAVGQLTPSLDARLSVFEKRMDDMDTKIFAAEDRMVKGMDAQATLAEDRLVNRMNTEIPAMLDKYVAKKMTELKH